VEHSDLWRQAAFERERLANLSGQVKVRLARDANADLERLAATLNLFLVLIDRISPPSSPQSVGDMDELSVGDRAGIIASPTVSTSGGRRQVCDAQRNAIAITRARLDDDPASEDELLFGEDEPDAVVDNVNAIIDFAKALLLAVAGGDEERARVYLDKLALDAAIGVEPSWEPWSERLSRVDDVTWHDNEMDDNGEQG
jgi:hypothetical protein